MENNGNYSINGSVSGSNHGSNGQNGSCTAATNGATNVESDNGTGGKSGADGASGSGHGSGIEQNRSAQREAALTKFRQKRKERCYEKKVIGSLPVLHSPFCFNFNFLILHNHPTQFYG